MSIARDTDAILIEEFALADLGDALDAVMARMLTEDEARRIAANFANPPKLLNEPQN